MLICQKISLCITANLCTGMADKKKKKMMYLTTKNAGLFFFCIQFLSFETSCLFCFPIFVLFPLSDFDRHELLIYEEVAKFPPFLRKTLVLIGAPGVGKRSLKNKLLVSDPQHYGTTIPCESSLAVSSTVFTLTRARDSFMIMT